MKGNRPTFSPADAVGALQATLSTPPTTPHPEGSILIRFTSESRKRANPAGSPVAGPPRDCWGFVPPAVRSIGSVISIIAPKRCFGFRNEFVARLSSLVVLWWKHCLRAESRFPKMLVRVSLSQERWKCVCVHVCVLTAEERSRLSSGLLQVFGLP